MFKVITFATFNPFWKRTVTVATARRHKMSGLRLDNRAAFLAGGTNGKIIVAGKSAESIAYKRVAGVGDLSRMPFGGQPLPPAQIELIRAWIDQGADISRNGGGNVRCS